MKNERLGLTRAQQSVYGRLVAKATATIGLSGDHSFLPVIGSKRRSNVYDAQEHFPSGPNFCQPCPMFDGVDIVHINPLRGFRRQLGGMVMNVRLQNVNLSVCLSTVGAVQECHRHFLKKVTTF